MVTVGSACCEQRPRSGAARHIMEPSSIFIRRENKPGKRDKIPDYERRECTPCAMWQVPALRLRFHRHEYIGLAICGRGDQGVFGILRIGAIADKVLVGNTVCQSRLPQSGYIERKAECRHFLSREGIVYSEELCATISIRDRFDLVSLDMRCDNRYSPLLYCGLHCFKKSGSRCNGINHIAVNSDALHLTPFRAVCIKVVQPAPGTRKL